LSRRPTLYQEPVEFPKQSYALSQSLTLRCRDGGKYRVCRIGRVETSLRSLRSRPILRPSNHFSPKTGLS